MLLGLVTDIRPVPSPQTEIKQWFRNVNNLGKRLVVTLFSSNLPVGKHIFLSRAILFGIWQLIAQKREASCRPVSQPINCCTPGSGLSSSIDPCSMDVGPSSSLFEIKRDATVLFSSTDCTTAEAHLPPTTYASDLQI